jgi:hypothetical protein
MWLLGLPQPTLNCTPPTLDEVLQVVTYNHLFKKSTLAVSYSEVADQLIDITTAGHVPMQKK